jgi:hypothetical protein
VSAGYGRGYYGENQLAKPQRRGGSGWIKIALVVGVGAVVWLMWPRKAAVGTGLGYDPKQPPLPPPPTPGGQIAAPMAPPAVQAQALPPATYAMPAQPALPPPATYATPAPPSSYPPNVPVLLPPLAGTPESRHAQQIDQQAQARGYPSSKDYEDAVVASARQLKDTGAKVVLAPHLAHLAARLEP